MEIFKGIREYIHTKREQKAERELHEREAEYQEADRRSAERDGLHEEWLAGNREKRAQGSTLYDRFGYLKDAHWGHVYTDEAGREITWDDLKPEVQDRLIARGREIGEAIKKSNREHREAELNRLRTKVEGLKGK